MEFTKKARVGGERRERKDTENAPREARRVEPDSRVGAALAAPRATPTRRVAEGGMTPDRMLLLVVLTVGGVVVGVVGLLVLGGML